MNKNKKAFTLLEIVVSLGILTLGVLGIFSLIPTGIDQTNRGHEQSKAIILAQSKLEEITLIANENWDSFINGDHTSTDKPLNIGPVTDQEREKWGWIKDKDGLWLDNIGYQWIWYFVGSPVSKDNIALITLNVSWPQNQTIDSGKPVNQLKNYYRMTNTENSKNYFKNNNKKFIRLVSYISQGI